MTMTTELIQMITDPEVRTKVYARLQEKIIASRGQPDVVREPLLILAAQLIVYWELDND